MADKVIDHAVARLKLKVKILKPQRRFDRTAVF